MKNNNYKVYVHKVDTKEGPMYYAGVTSHLKSRWQPSSYKSTALYPFIQSYGWDSIEHCIIADGLDRETALRAEDNLICMYRNFGCSINHFRSGRIKVKNKAEYSKDYYSKNRELRICCNKKCYENHRDERLESFKRYYREHLDERKEYNTQYYNEHREERLEYDHKRNAKPERKIYTRVRNWNRTHPDEIYETPLEAKQKYMETGYIPNYIKNDDLIN